MPVETSRIAEGADRNIEWAIAVHGGAGGPANLTAKEIATYERALKAALETGRTILADGGTALDAVEQTIRLLEDDPLFNAGKGAVFNSAGTHELDASIMDGRDRSAGAVAGVRTVKNPISLARLVMTETSHVLLVADGAERFADELRERRQIERVENDWFSTRRRREQWERAQQKERERREAESHKGTVGCVALDAQGNLAAGTSTGGTTNKKFGRVGDSPIIGAGTCADNATCAVSCTGTGEHFIRNSVAFHVSALMKYKGLSLEEAVHHVIFEVLDEGVGGLIAVGRDGSISMQTNTAGLSRGAADSTGRFEVKLGK